MSRRASGVPQTPVHNDDALERSLRRQQQSSTRGSLTDVARRVHDSPLNRSRSGGSSANTSQSIDMGMQPAQVAPADFQEWMKMVRMKRVKANNAFAIQLIDAFHSMVQGEVLSKGAANVTFQEATHTLGGCLTVYKNRIARVKDDTSKLLVGVSENKKASEKADDEESVDDMSDEDGEEDSGQNPSAKSKKKPNKTPGVDSFLAPAHKLEIDTNELATSIDPLLRKMSADFDKRGAGALLQYSLRLDRQGRLLLDAEAQEMDCKPESIPVTNHNTSSQQSSNASQRLPGISEEEEEEEGEGQDQSTSCASEIADSSAVQPSQTANKGDTKKQDNERDTLCLARFNVTYFANADLSHREALPMIDGIARAVVNPAEGTESLINDMQAWALTDPGNSSTYQFDEYENGEYDQGGDEEQSDNNLGGGGELEGLGLDLNGDFNGVFPDDPASDDGDVGNADGSADLSLNSIVSTRMPTSGNWMDIEHLQRLDTQQTNWAGPSFWKIRRLHARDQEQNEAAQQSAEVGAQQKLNRAARKMAHAATVIDFINGEEVDIDDLFTPRSRSTKLSSKQYDLQDKHLLPVDMHVTTQQLLSLQLRPALGIAPAFKSRMWTGAFDNAGDATIDPETGLDSIAMGNGDGTVNNDNDNYFYGGWEDPPDMPRPATASEMFSQTVQSGYGAQNNQLNFARTAKRIDVRRLKDNVWKAIRKEEPPLAPEPGDGSPRSSIAAVPQPEDDMPKETTLIKVIQDTQPLYSDLQRSDLSPAMYFISLLHLSNEKGLTLHNIDTFTDIRITCNS